MRILKRNLAFVLVLVMALSLTVSAANVNDYKDANDVTYVEAVDVMTFLGILQGEDGVFNPQNTLTREQGAKIIAYMMLGKNAADKLTTSVAPFADVAANRWSAGYVAYCANKGIIGGYGDGNFGPNDQLTATQFAKMLLCAVGYGVNGEFSGNGWESAVNSTALVNGVFEGNDELSLGAACTREEAALYAFNTLTAVLPVQYSKAFDCYYTGTVLNSVDKNTNGWEKYTLAKTLYNMEKVTKNGDDPVTDDFGRVCHYWKQGSKETTKFYDAPKATYTKAVSSKALYAALGLGSKTPAAATVKGNTAMTTFALDKDDAAKTIGGNGTVVEAYVGANNAVTLVVIESQLAKVKADAKDGTVSVTLCNDATTKTFDTEVKYKKDEYVVVTLDGSNTTTAKVVDMTPVEKVNGKLEVVAATVSNPYVKVDGVKYYFAQNKASGINFVTNDFKSTMSLLLDEYGYVLGIVTKEKAEVSATGYVWVEDCEYNAGSLLTSKAAVVKVLHLDGTGYEVLPLPTQVATVDGEKQNQVMIPGRIKDSKTVTDWAEMKNDNKVKQGFYSYYMDDDNCIVLKDLVATKEYFINNGTVSFNGVSQKGTVSDGTNNLSDKLLNSASELVLVSKSKAETITGYKNIKIDVNQEKSVNALIILDTEGGSVMEKVIVIDGEIATDKVYAYYNGETYVSNNAKYVVLYINGEEVSYKYTSADSLAKGGYTITTSGTTLNTATPVAAESAKVTVKSVSALYFTDSSDVKHYYAEDAKIFDVTDGGAAGTIAVGDKVTCATDAKTGLVTFAWVVEHN